jgi:hypothetical protein
MPKHFILPDIKEQTRLFPFHMAIAKHDVEHPVVPAAR